MAEQTKAAPLFETEEVAYRCWITNPPSDLVWSEKHVARIFATLDAERAKTAANLEIKTNMMEQITALRARCDAAEKALKEASEERFRFLKEREAEAEKWRVGGDMYGWNFHQGMAAGANWCDIFYHRVTKALTEQHP